MLTDAGAVDLNVPRDRAGSFDPKVVPKGARRLDGFNDQIISLVVHGMTTRDVASHIEDIYGVPISPELVSLLLQGVRLSDDWKHRDRIVLRSNRGA